MKFHLSDNLVLGPDLVVSTTGIFATKGMGKTHAAQVMAEEMLAHGQVVVAIDPTDAWWGLRASADGKADGYPVVVIGGDHGDLKLEPGAAVQLAEAVVAERFSCVICTDGLSDMAETRFVREFLDTLYRKNREPLHVFVDEADIFAPQKPFDPEDARCIRAMSHIVRRGRKKGIGSTLITQRPAELNASVRSQVEMLFVLGMLNNLDIDAVEKWLRLRKKKRGDNAAFALQEEMIESLDSLQRGDAWVWAPRMGIHKRIRARAKRTFDSGATPKPGQKVKAPKKLAAVDLQRLGQAMAEAVQRQKESDPTELKKQIAELRKELSRVGKGQDRAEAHEKANHAENVELRIAVARLTEERDALLQRSSAIGKAELSRLEKAVARAAVVLEKHDAAVSRHHQAYQGALENYTTSSKAAVSKAVEAVDALRLKLLAPAPAAPALPQPVQPSTKTVSKSAKPVVTQSSKSSKEIAHEAGLEPAHLRILSAIAWWESLGVPSPDLGGVAFAAQTSTTSSAFNNNRSRLRAAGYIDYPSSGRVQLTEAGRALAPPPELPPTNEALQNAILGKVPPALGRLLRVLIAEYPNELTLADFAARAETSISSSAFNNNRSWLRARGLADYPRTGFVRATPLLFPEAS